MLLTRGHCPVGGGDHSHSIPLKTQPINCAVAPSPPPEASANNTANATEGGNGTNSSGLSPPSSPPPEIDLDCEPNATRYDPLLSTGDAWVPPMSNPNAHLTPAESWVYRTFPDEHRGTVCADSGRWILTLEPLAQPMPADASRLKVDVELTVSFAAMPSLVDLTTCVVIEGEDQTVEDCRLRGTSVTGAAFGVPQFFFVNVTEPQATLLIELVYTDQVNSELPPPPMRLLYNGATGGCPSLVAHQMADWWPRMEMGSYGLDSLQRPEEWSQRLIQGVSAPLPVGVHHLALLGSAASEGSALQLSAAVVCQAGFANADVDTVGGTANFSGVCSRCPPGEAKSFGSGSALCKKCIAGTYTGIEGSTGCLPCGSGSRQALEGQEKCAPCERGKFSVLNDGISIGPLSCSSCEPGTYMHLDGASSCFKCPEHSLTNDYGATGLQECNCRYGHFTPKGSNGTQCFSCPEGAECGGGRNLPHPKRGFMELVSHRYVTVYPACASSTLLSQEICRLGGYCTAGHTGRACSQCEPFYYKYDVFCRKCANARVVFGDGPNPDDAPRVTSQMAMAIVLIFLGSWCVAMYALTEPELLDEFASVYALIFFLQTLDHFSGMSLDWPMEVRALFSALSLANFNLQLLAMDCYDGWGGLPRRLALQFSIPLLCLAIYCFLLLSYAMLLYLARLQRGESPLAALVRLQKSPRLAHALDRTVGAYQALLYVMYPMLLINVISIFDCRPVDDSVGLSVLDAQPSIDCYSEEHTKLFPLALVAGFVYVIGIPVLLFGGLHKGAPLQLAKPVFKARYGFLYLRYERACEPTAPRTRHSPLVSYTTHPSPLTPHPRLVVRDGPTGAARCGGLVHDHDVPLHHRASRAHAALPLLRPILPGLRPTLRVTHGRPCRVRFAADLALYPPPRHPLPLRAARADQVERGLVPRGDDRHFHRAEPLHRD